MIVMVILNTLFERAPGRYLNWLAFLVWPAGWLAFRLKQYNQRYYGMVEIPVGIATALGITMKGAFGPTQALAVLGAMYVVSRGYTNIAEAKKKKVEIENNAKVFHEKLGCKKAAWSRFWGVLTRREVPANLDTLLKEKAAEILAKFDEQQKDRSG
jgi:hypothetical protein